MGPVAGPDGISYFTTPSGNIACEVSSDDDVGGARCDLQEHDWTAPARPEDCITGYGDSLYVGRDGPGFGCVGDTIANDTVAPYGSTVTRGKYTCRIGETGVACWNLDTGAGFAVSRGEYAFY